MGECMRPRCCRQGSVILGICCVPFLVMMGLASTASDVGAWERSSNVLMIAIDDLKTIGTFYADEEGSFLAHVYPDPLLRNEVAQRMTPNIQRLADRGVRFMNAYCAAPSCNPSRAALMTGIRPAWSGLTTNAGGIFFRQYKYRGQKRLADAVTLPEHLKRNGWYTAETGKIFHNGSSFAKSDGNRSWTAWANVGGGAGEKKRDRYSPRSLDWGQEGDDNATFEMLNDIRKADFISQVLRKGHARYGETTFRINERQPFFLACGIFRPHLPFYASRDLLDLFPVQEMSVDRKLLEYFTGDAGDLPPQAYGWCGLSVDAKGYPKIGNDRFVDILRHGKKIGGDDGDLVGWKRMLQHYFACCAIADRAVGRLLDGLDAGGFAENTMIVLWSDHGYHLGEKLHETKFTLWDAGANVNLIVVDPRHRDQAGNRCDTPVSLLDIFPTINSLAGLELPEQPILGRDLEPLLAAPQSTWPGAVLTTHQNDRNHMLRTQGYKLIRYDNDDRSVELYDMQADPEEYNNLAGDDKHASTLAKLIVHLDTMLETTQAPTQ